MSTDYKALCAELVALDGHCVVDCTEEWSDAMCRLRAALAQPEPVAPTDEELEGMWIEQYGYTDYSPAMSIFGFKDAARAVLARWGTPADNTRGTH